METTKDIELRSEKVRNIIGHIPPFLVRSGMGVIAVVVALALAVCYFIPHYETVEGHVEILGDHGQILLPYEYQWKSSSRGHKVTYSEKYRVKIGYLGLLRTFVPRCLK